jgi:hypothetical protein
VPSGDWPAYAYGKAILIPCGFVPGYVLCGLHTEKGFGKEPVLVFPKLKQQKKVLDGTWSFSRFLDGLRDGSVERAAQQVAQASGSQVFLQVSAYYASNPTDFDPYRTLDGDALGKDTPKPDAGHVWFAVDGGGLRTEGQRRMRPMMEPVAACRALAELPAALESSKDLAWTWVDVYVGALVTLDTGEPRQGTRYEASDIWLKLMRPWMAWIR